jgi:long-chain acyl-CoA synthetase
VTGGFRWHPEARLIDGRGRRQAPVRQALQVIGDRPSALAVAAALAAPGVFRIGLGLPAPDPVDAERAFETLTSGSTGTPRRIRRSQSSWTASFAVNAGLFGIGPGVRLAVLGRLVQSLSLYGALEGMYLGGEVHLLDDLRPDRQRRELASRGIEVLYASPAQLRQMAGQGPLCPALRLILLGGAKLDRGLRSDLATMAPNADIREFYGAAETSFVTLAGPGDPEGSVGQPYPGVDIRAVGSREAPGLIEVRSPYLFEGYAGEAAGAGAAQWRDGWLSLGEMGWLEQGCLYLAGRAGRMITIAGHNVFPEEVEGVLLSQPGVLQAAVLPLPDPLRGTVLVAVLQGDPGEEPRILTATRAALGPLKAPRSITWRESWPLLPSGKTDLAALSAGLA